MNSELIEKTAQKVNLYGNLDEVARRLQVFREAGVNVYVDFNGQKLYALLDDLDSCYVKVTGKTKKEFELAEKKWREDYEKRKAEAAAKAEAAVPSYIEAGKTLVYPQKQKEWEQCVKVRVSDLYHGAELKNAIDAMKVLQENGDFEKAKKVIDGAGHSGASYGMTMNIIISFSKVGPDFYEFMEPEDSKDPETQKFLEQVRKENQKFEEELANGQTGYGE